MIIYAVIILSGVGLIFGFFLAIAGKKFAVKIDPKQEKILKILPGANDGACGYPGCSGYAEALVKGKAEIGKCTVGGEDVNRKIAQILGKEPLRFKKKVAVILCGGNDEKTIKKFDYAGIKNCKALKIFGGHKKCDWGCFEFGDCIESCEFNAINFDKDGLPEINPQKCTACGKCLKVCPQNIIEFVPFEKKVHILCKNKENGGKVRKICKAGCFTCSLCVKACPKNAIEIVNNLAKIDYDRCDNCGICIEKCPTKTIIKSEFPQIKTQISTTVY